MPKNLLIKKILKLTLFFTMLFYFHAQTQAMTKDTTTECWVPSNLGTANEEVVPLTLQDVGARCDFDIPSDYLPNDGGAYKEPRKGLCAKAVRCRVRSINDAFVVSGENMFFLADPGVDSTISGALQFGTNSSMGAYDKAYATLADCQRDNPDRVVGFIPRVGAPPLFTKFRDLNSCKTAFNSALSSLYGTAIGQGDPNNSGSCYWVPPGSYLNRALTLYQDQNSCSCRKCSVLNVLDTSICWGLTSTVVGSISLSASKEVFNSKTTLSENLADCEAAHSDRYQNKNTRQCYTTLDSCKQADTGTCDISKDKHLFVKIPGSPDRTYTPTEIDTKNNQLKTCALNQKTFQQCLNEVFGAGPTSSTLTSTNFFTCECSEDSSCTALTGSCPKVCTLNPARLANFNIIKPVTINSPLALIKVVVNFLFWLAVVIFIINMLSAALDYIKGGDQPDKLKEASDRITGTIFGFVFLLVASGVINYIIERVTEFIP